MSQCLLQLQEYREFATCHKTADHLLNRKRLLRSVEGVTCCHRIGRKSQESKSGTEWEAIDRNSMSKKSGEAIITSLSTYV